MKMRPFVTLHPNSSQNNDASKISPKLEATFDMFLKIINIEFESDLIFPEYDKYHTWSNSA